MVKKFFAGFAAGLILALSTTNTCLARTISGPGGDVEIEFPDDFYTIYIDDNENNELTNHLDITYDTIKSRMEENDIYAGGVNDDDSIEISAIIEYLGQDYGSMSDYPDETLKDFLEEHRKKLENEKYTNITIERLNDHYYMATYDMEDEFNTSHIISYNTFSGKYIYSLNALYTNPENYDAARAYLDEITDTFKIPQTEKKSGFIDISKWKIQWLIIGLITVTVIIAGIVIRVSRKKHHS